MLYTATRPHWAPLVLPGRYVLGEIALYHRIIELSMHPDDDGMMPMQTLCMLAAFCTCLLHGRGANAANGCSVQHQTLLICNV